MKKRQMYLKRKTPYAKKAAPTPIPKINPVSRRDRMKITNPKTKKRKLVTISK